MTADYEQAYVGRRDFLRKLEDVWKSYRLVQIHGLRSVGKTRTIKVFLEQQQQHHQQQQQQQQQQHEQDVCSNEDQTSSLNLCPDTKGFKVVTVDMRTCQTVPILHSQMCAQLGVVPLKHAGPSDLWMKQVVDTVNRESNFRQCVVVIDNAEDAFESDMKDAVLSFCNYFIINCTHANVVISTTTNAQFSSLMKTFCSLELPPMTIEDSCRLLRQMAPDVQLGDLTEKLAGFCEGLPLALMIVASVLSLDDGLLSPSEMVELLLKCRLDALSPDCYPVEDRIGPKYQTFIKRLSDVFQDRLSILGYIPGSFQATEAMTILDYKTTAEVKQGALVPLRQRNMLQVTVSPEIKSHRFDIHGILRDCLRMYFTIKNITEVRARYIRAFTEVMSRISKKMDTTDYARAVAEFSLEHPNLHKLLTQVYHTTEDTYPFFIEVAASCTTVIEEFMAEQGQVFYTKCLEMTKEFRRENDMATVYIALGSMLTNNEGKFLVAEDNFRRAKSILQSGPPTEQLARLYYSMGYNLYIQGRGADALRYAKLSVELLDKLGFRETEVYLTSLSYLGVVNTFLGQHKDGKNCHLLVLEVRKKKQGECHPSVGAAYNRLGVLYEQQKDYAKAMEFYQKGLDVKKSSKAAYWSIVFSLNNVALQHALAGDRAKAKRMLTEARQILTGRAESNLAPLSLICNSFGKVHLMEKNFRRAVVEMEEATRIRETTMAKGPFIVSTLLLLARSYLGVGRYSEAKARLDQALEKKSDLIERLPHNDLVYKCLVCRLQVYYKTNEITKVDQTVGELEDEIRRLIYVFQFVRSDEEKVKQFREKAELLTTQHTLHAISKLELN